MPRIERGARLLHRVGERLRVIQTPEQRAAQAAERQARIERERELREQRNERIHHLVHNSDADWGETDYILGVSPTDPHPNHLITFKDPSDPTYVPYIRRTPPLEEQK